MFMYSCMFHHVLNVGNYQLVSERILNLFEMYDHLFTTYIFVHICIHILYTLYINIFTFDTNHLWLSYIIQLLPWGKMPRYGWLACHLMQQMQHLRWRCFSCGHGWKIIGFLVRRYILWTSSKMIRMFHCHVSFSRGVPVGKLLDSLLPS